MYTGMHRTSTLAVLPFSEIDASAILSNEQQKVRSQVPNFIFTLRLASILGPGDFRATGHQQMHDPLPPMLIYGGRNANIRWRWVWCGGATYI